MATNQLDAFWDWYEKNKLELFWYKYRVFMGLDPEGKSTWLQEKMHFAAVEEARKKSFEADNVHQAFEVASFLDMQALLEKWWNDLDNNAKEAYLIKTWFQKMDGHLYGLDWWLTYFDDVGYITNCDVPRPSEPIVLYRGIEPPFRLGMSWTNNINMAETFAESESLISNKYVYGTIVQPESILAIFKGNAVNVDGSPLMDHGVEFVVNHRHLSFDDIYAVDDPRWSNYKKQNIS